MKNWIQHDIVERDQYFSELISVFDFTEFSATCLKTVVADSMMKTHLCEREKVIEIMSKKLEKLQSEHRSLSTIATKCKANTNLSGQLKSRFKSIASLAVDQMRLGGMIFVGGLRWELGITKTLHASD